MTSAVRNMLMLGVVAMLVGALAGASRPQSQQEHLENGKCHCDLGHSDERRQMLFWGISSTGWTAIATILLVFATLLLAYIAYNQFQTSQAQTRAYIGVDSGGMRYVDLVEGGKGFAIHVELRNFGQTPGYGLTSWMHPPKILAPDAIPFEPATPIEDREGSSMIGPHSNVSRDWTIPVSEEELAALKTGERKIFVWGGVDFTDAFGKKRYFVFRITNGNAALINQPGNAMSIQPHKLGYDAN